MNPCLILALATLLTGCGLFRPLIRDWSNDDLKGSVAPPLSEGSWILPDEATGQPVAAPEGWRPPTSKWRMLVFFLPG